ncbi:proline-rich domain-containing protein [Streptomyces hokutonensis]|uniref:proline-rich domain-containing protein n=1 Tax=Streptomyces hokutonensis TaxID=1306990 RepID=UPI003403541A
MSDPVSRTILLLDIERYSDRDDVEQAYLRRMLYDITDRTLESAGIDETRRLRADRGDSVMELIDASAPVTALLRALLTEVPVRLKAVNRMASRSAQIRLRGVVATGYVAVDLHDGWVGSDLNHACRLLDADVLRAALRERTADFALCVSDALYAGVVRHDHPGIPADDFHRVTVASKNGPLEAWLHGPVPEVAAGENHGDTGEGEAQGGSGDRPAPRTPASDAPAPDDREERVPPQGGSPENSPAPDGTRGAPAPGVVFHFNGGSPSFGGSLVGHDQHGVSGGQVTGDVHLGGHERGDGA